MSDIEDCYSDDDEKANNLIKINFINKLNSILTNTKYDIKNYNKIFSFLTFDDYELLNKGKGPIAITLEYLNFFKEFETFKDISKKRNKILSVVYITPEQTRKYISYGGLKKFLDIVLTKKQIKDTIKNIKKINKNINSLFLKFNDYYDDFNILLQRQYDEFISSLMKYSSKTPMLKSRRQLDLKVIRNLLEEKQKVGIYFQVLVHIQIKQIVDLLKKCTQGKTKGDFKLDFNYKTKSRIKTYPFVLFLTKRQKRYYYM